MTRPNAIQAADPWRSPVTVAQIPESGLHRDIEADPATRETMAELAGLREVLFARATFDVTVQSGGRVHDADVACPFEWCLSRHYR